MSADDLTVQHELLLRSELFGAGGPLEALAVLPAVVIMP